MNNGTRPMPKNPKGKAFFLSQFFICWTWKIVKKGASNALTISDVYGPLKSEDSELLGNKLEREWNRELEKCQSFTASSEKDKKIQPSLTKALMRAFLWENVFLGFLMLIQSLARTAMPIFQGKVIAHFDTHTPQSEAMYRAACMIFFIFVITFTWHHTWLKGQQIGMRMRIACTALIYRKLLRIEKSSLSQTAGGQVMNLLGTDVTRFDDLIPMVHWLYCAVFQTITITIILWNIVGYAAMIGIACTLIISTPSSVVISKLSKVIRLKIAVITDKRIQLMNELLAGIQIIKMYAWETPFIKMVSQTRAAEIKKVRLSSYLKAFMLGTYVIVERLILYVTIVSYSLMGRTLSSDITFILATYFNSLQMAVSILVPQGVFLLGETMISIQRIQEYLLSKEISESKKKEAPKLIPLNGANIEKEKENEISLNEVAIKFDHVYANWISKQLPPTLINISMEIKPGSLSAVIGTVGSGKTAILNVLLRELSVGSGIVSIRQKSDFDLVESSHVTGYVVDNPNLSISYASQDAWLFTGTVKDNILFGQPFEEERYKQVTKVCALHRDFQQFPYGDMSLVGERGVTLSGGQRARINLARAVYKKADLYLFDDPLSAVDTRVGQHLFDKCIVEFLAAKTRVLVTHQLQFLGRADKVVLLESGTVAFQGTYKELLRLDFDVIQTLKNTDRQNENSPGVSENLERSYKRSSKRSSTRSRLSRRSISSYVSSFENYENNEETAQENEEEIKQGSMKKRTYAMYFKFGGSSIYLCILFSVFAISQIFNSTSDYWTSYWTNADYIRSQVEKGIISKDEYEKWANNTFMSRFGYDINGFLQENNFIYIYSFLICFVVITNFTRGALFMRNCLSASYNLHNIMFENIIRTTMLFFNNSPSGRILNRFSKDVGVIDEILPKCFMEMIQIFLVLTGILFLVAIVNVWMLIPVIIIGTFIILLRKYFMRTISVLKRFEGVAKSPVFSHVNSTLQGLETVRSGGKRVQSMMKKQFDDYQNTHTGTDYLMKGTASSFCLLVDLCCAFFVGCITIILILTKSEHDNGSSVGLAISQSLILTGMLQYGLRQSMEVAIQMTAVERVLQYTTLPKESPLETSDPLPPDWPSAGRVVFQDVYMRYKVEEPPVLKNLNVTIEPGWKVGVCGRTGAGKSSLIAALFRLCSADCLEGLITIDDRDTASVGLCDLRSRISIIPQEPVLFSKSLRYNLDPFNAFPDSALYEAVKEVELNDVSLDQQVSEGGSNFSVGQRQLICLARAILRNNRILVLDEATANIDNHTDALIQRTIRKRFADCTVLTIAHRLNTIIDSDRILVMNNGQLEEFDTPYELLCNKPDGHFSKMVKQLGLKMSEELTKLAKSAQSQKM